MLFSYLQVTGNLNLDSLVGIFLCFIVVVILKEEMITYFFVAFSLEDNTILPLQVELDAPADEWSWPLLVVRLDSRLGWTDRYSDK